MSSIQMAPIPGTEPGRTNSSWSNLLTLALMYPEIRRKMRQARELRQLQAELKGEIDVARGVGPEADPGWLARRLTGQLTDTAAGPPPPSALPPVAAMNPFQPAAGPEMGMGGLLTGLAPASVDRRTPVGMAGLPPTGAIRQPTDWPAEMTARLAALPRETMGGGGWLPLERLGAMQTSAPEAPPGAAPSWLEGLPLAHPASGGGGLDALFGTDKYRGRAVQAAMLGDPRWLNLQPQGFVPTREQQAGAFEWGVLGGKEKFVQGELTKRAREAGGSRLQIARDRLTDAATRAQDTRLTANARAAYGRAVDYHRLASQNYQRAAEGGEQSFVDLGDYYEGQAQAESRAGQQYEAMAPAAGPAAPVLGTGPEARPAAGAVGPAVRPSAGAPAAGTFAPAVPGRRPVAGPGGLPPLYDTSGRPKVQVSPGGRIQRQLDVTMRGQDLGAQAAGERIQISRANLQLARERFAWARTHGGAEKAAAAAQGFQAFFGMDPRAAAGIAALAPSLQIAALKARGIIRAGDEKDVAGLTRTMMSKMDFPYKVKKDPQQMRRMVNQVHGVAQELVTGWKAARAAVPTAPAGITSPAQRARADLETMGPLGFVREYRSRGADDPTLRAALLAANVSASKVDEALAQER